jgi:hypothetical protein
VAVCDSGVLHAGGLFHDRRQLQAETASTSKPLIRMQLVTDRRPCACEWSVCTMCGSGRH